MKLYYSPNSISIVVAIALEEMGLPYEKVLVDFASSEQTSATYLKTNPKGRVPALATQQGILTETGAILEYLQSLSTSTGLIPSDAFQAARMREAMYYLASTMHINHAHKRRGNRWVTNQSSIDDMQAKVAENMNASCAYMRDNFPLTPYVLGAHFSLADPYFYIISTWLEGDGVDITRYPELIEFKAAMESRASVQSVIDAGLLDAQ